MAKSDPGSNAAPTMDAGLLTRIRLGDEAAFQMLFLAFFARLADYAYGLTGTREAAEDVVQDVFAEVWTKRSTLPSVQTLRGYLYRAVRNRALNLSRARAVRRRVHQVLSLTAVSTVAPEDPVALQELRNAVVAAVNNLPPRTKEVLLLSRVNGLQYAEIAQTLGISIKTVEALMTRALAAIRAQLP